MHGHCARQTVRSLAASPWMKKTPHFTDGETEARKGEEPAQVPQRQQGPCQNLVSRCPAESRAFVFISLCQPPASCQPKLSACNYSGNLEPQKWPELAQIRPPPFALAAAAEAGGLLRCVLLARPRQDSPAGSHPMQQTPRYT